MTRPLSSYPEDKRKEIAVRRVKNKTLGLGYLSAVAYLAKIGKTVVAEKKEEK
jgi:hypothetical protein